jgi:hypothetical protein
MGSKQRLEANRSNAKRSTGPCTQPGKARSKMNALKHGLAAKSVVIDGEDPREFEALRAGLEREFDVQTMTEHELVGDLAALFWRQRRVPRFEAAITQNALEGILVHDEDDKVQEIYSLVHGDVLIKLTRIETSLANRIRRNIDQLARLRASRLEAQEATRLIEYAARPEGNSVEDNSADNSALMAITEPNSGD